MYSVSNKKSIALFEQALSKYGGQMYDEALSLADKAIKMEPRFLEAYWLKADIAQKTGNNQAEIQSLGKALEIAPGDATTIIGLADAYFAQYDNPNALLYYKQLMQKQQLPEKYQKRAIRNMEVAQFRIDAMANPYWKPCAAVQR